MVSRDDLEGEAGPELGKLERIRNRETQGWQDEERVYVLVGADPDVSLAGLL